MQTIEFGKVCPAHDWVEAGEFHCRYCKHMERMANDATECRYTKEPENTAPFKKGDEVWRVERLITTYAVQKVKVRVPHWDGSRWVYVVGREQHYCECFATKHEADVYAAQMTTKDVLNTLKELKQTMERNNISIDEIVPKGMLEQGVTKLLE